MSSGAPHQARHRGVCIDFVERARVHTARANVLRARTFDNLLPRFSERAWCAYVSVSLIGARLRGSRALVGKHTHSTDQGAALTWSRQGATRTCAQQQQHNNYNATDILYAYCQDVRVYIPQMGAKR